MFPEVSLATPEDASRIAEIHMTAFGPNAMLRAQFPTPIARNALQHLLEKKTLAEIQDPNTTVLVVRRRLEAENNNERTADGLDLNTAPNGVTAPVMGGKVVGFAKWVHPTKAQEHNEKIRSWPDGTAVDVLNDWTRITEEAYDAVMGSTLCYKLTFIGVDPGFQRQGAGSLMVDWGIRQCEKTGYPAYLESTVEAVPFYEKIGFQAAASVSLDISGRTDGKGERVYREMVLVHIPSAISGSTGSKSAGLDSYNSIVSECAGEGLHGNGLRVCYVVGPKVSAKPVGNSAG